MFDINFEQGLRKADKICWLCTFLRTPPAWLVGNEFRLSIGAWKSCVVLLLHRGSRNPTEDLKAGST